MSPDWHYQIGHYDGYNANTPSLKTDAYLMGYADGEGDYASAYEEWMRTGSVVVNGVELSNYVGTVTIA